MEPTVTNTIVTIQNPTEDSIVINPTAVLSAEDVVEQYGGKIKHGAFVSLTERDGRDNTIGGSIFVADREVDGRLYLQNNEYLLDGDGADIDSIGSVCASGEVELDASVVEGELETFTVYGINDDHQTFTAVITATEATAEEVGIKAGLVDDGYEHLVKIAAILKGNQTGLEL